MGRHQNLSEFLDGNSAAAADPAADASKSLLDEFLSSAKHAAVQAPAEGLSQLSNHLLGTEFKPQLVDRPEAAEFGTRAWHSQQLGGAVGMTPWFVGAHYLTRGLSKSLTTPVSAETVSLMGREMSKRTLMLGESAFAGGLVGGFLEPTTGRDLIQTRINNAMANGATFLAMGKVTQALDAGAISVQRRITGGFAENTRSFLADRGRAAALAGFSGAAVGPFDALLKVGINEHRLATWEEAMQAGYGFGFAGAGMGAFGPGRKRAPNGEHFTREPIKDSAGTTPITSDANARVRRSAAQLISELTTMHPQVVDGKVNYYLGGSLAIMALAEAGEFRLLDHKQLPAAEPIAGTRKLGAESTAALDRFTRKIGDLDFIPLDHYSNTEGRMTKGGGGPQVADFSPAARAALKQGAIGDPFMCDPVAAVNGDHRIAVVKLNGNDVYINAPADALAYKVVHIMEKLGNCEANPKFAGDFNGLYDALKGHYTPEQLAARTNQILSGYNPKSANSLWVPEHSPEYTGQLKTFIDRVIQLNADASYLPGLQIGPERSLSVLRILNRLEGPIAKQQAIDLINANRKGIDHWELVDSLHNRRIAAEELLRTPELVTKYETHLGSGPLTVESVATRMEQLPWIKDEVARGMPAETPFQRYPKNSELLAMLMHVDPVNARTELPAVAKLLEGGIKPFSIQQIFETKFGSDPANRQMLVDSLSRAQSVLDAKQFQRFNYELKQAIEDGYRMDSTGKYYSIDAATMARGVQVVLDKYNVNVPK